MRIPISSLTILTCLALASGCASHKIMSAHPDGRGIGGEPIEHGSLSIFGAQGLSSDGTGYVATPDCGTDALVSVEVERNFLQGVATVLTLGAVSPATIKFYCHNFVPEPDPDEPASDDEF